MIEILNLSPSITIEDIGTPNIYRSNTRSVKILKVIPGITKKLVLFVNETSVCEGYKIFSKNIIIPYYNKFKDHELCVNNKEHTLCKENSSIKITEEEFIRIMNDYIEEKNKKPIDEDEDIPEKVNASLMESLMDFLTEYYIYILLGIIAVGSIGIVAIQMNKKRSIL